MNLNEEMFFEFYLRVSKEDDYSMLDFRNNKLVMLKEMLTKVLMNHLNYCGNLELLGNSPQYVFLPAIADQKHGYVGIKAFLRLKPIVPSDKDSRPT